ncbi:MAG: DUF4340 domain-containing protein [Gemmatimonadales bacterium]|nr:DUF4340 domain-containing protein [Gemmatimonadales bacterium]NIP08568.1 DUF4340 domain-containing protein [Gemmatimonadales bacterium]NIQ99105.1 DUF4340 domain-containing protein [Gemmatimonadales bacterium]NIS66075.1 DUF4340 domain-containing protein [Gemmatimonadales bacterium]
MTPRQLKRLAVVLVAVLILWGMLEMLGGRSDMIEEVGLLRPVTAAEVDTIELAGPDDTVRLVQSVPGTWSVNGYPASADGVSELFRAIAESVKASLVARSPSSHQRMGVDTASGKRLRIVRGDNTLANLVVGRQGRQFRTVYARRDGDDRVYLMEGALAPLLDRSLTDWRDKRIVAVEPDSITRVAVERGGSGYAIERAAEGWTFTDGGQTDSAAVSKLLGGFRDLVAQGAAFAAPEQVDSTDFVRPDRRVTLFGGQADTLAALVFDSTEAAYWVRHAAGGIIYRLYSWKVDDLAPADSSLRKKEEGQ